MDKYVQRSAAPTIGDVTHNINILRSQSEWEPASRPSDSCIMIPITLKWNKKYKER